MLLQSQIKLIIYNFLSFERVSNLSLLQIKIVIDTTSTSKKKYFELDYLSNSLIVAHDINTNIYQGKQK